MINANQNAETSAILDRNGNTAGMTMSLGRTKGRELILWSPENAPANECAKSVPAFGA